MFYAIEPFYGGSHKQFLDELQNHTDLNLQILAMTPHHWRWRMHGSALYFSDLIRKNKLEPGIILASDFVNLPAFRGFVEKPEEWKWMVYFHENQLTYPFRQKRPRDLTYAHMNIQSALAADAVYFNSRFHLEDFLQSIPKFYSRFVDFKPQEVPDRIREKAEVLPPGIDLRKYDSIHPAQTSSSNSGIILWNQRWEHDKNPELFFHTLFQLADENFPFRLIVCGEQFSNYPAIFDEAKKKLNNQIIHWGYAKTWSTYARLLHQADIVVSTADHEFFGIAVLEAIYCRCYPLLPKRLVYPEYIPDSRKEKNLFTSERDLYRKLKFALTRIEETRKIHFRDVAEQFDWSKIAPQWERVLGGYTNE